MKKFVVIVLDLKNEEKMKDLCFQIESLLSKPEFARSVYYKFENEENKNRLKYVIDDQDEFKDFSKVC